MVARRDLLAVASLNAVQGLPAYFFTLGMPALMREAGASLDVVTLTYIVWLPWALKWLWAPWFDLPRLPPFGTHSGWLRALPLAMALCFAALILVPPSGPPLPLILLALLSAMIGATLQVVLAAVIMDRFATRERSLANELQVAGMTVGSILGGGVLLYLGDRMGWRMGVALSVALILLLSLPGWWMRGTHSPPAAAVPPTRGIAAARAALRGKGRIILLMIAAGLAASGDALLPALLIDRGYAAMDVGWILGMAALAIMVPVSALAGLLVRVVGARQGLALMLGAKGIVSLSLAIASQWSPLTVAMLCVASFCLGGAIMVAFWQLYMTAIDTAHAASGFAAFTSLEALLLMCAGLGAGQAAAAAGYDPVYAVAAAAALLCVLLTAAMPARCEAQT